MHIIPHMLNVVVVHLHHRDVVLIWKSNPPKLYSTSNFIKSLESITYVSVIQSLCTMAEGTTVPAHSVKNCIIIGHTKQRYWQTWFVRFGYWARLLYCNGVKWDWWSWFLEANSDKSNCNHWLWFNTNSQQTFPKCFVTGGSRIKADSARRKMSSVKFCVSFDSLRRQFS